jgi:hypothetical protein
MIINTYLNEHEHAGGGSVDVAVARGACQARPLCGGVFLHTQPA